VHFIEEGATSMSCDIPENKKNPKWAAQHACRLQEIPSSPWRAPEHWEQSVPSAIRHY